MQARNKKTGAAITKVVERYMAITRLLDDSFDRMPDGSLTFDYQGDGAEVNWDCGDPANDENGQALYVDTNGDFVPESEIELEGVSEIAELVAPPVENATESQGYSFGAVAGVSSMPPDATAAYVRGLRRAVSRWMESIDERAVELERAGQMEDNTCGECGALTDVDNLETWDGVCGDCRAEGEQHRSDVKGALVDDTHAYASGALEDERQARIEERALRLASDALEHVSGDDETPEPGSQREAEIIAYTAVNEALQDIQTTNDA